jgi:hypothetical protein
VKKGPPKIKMSIFRCGESLRSKRTKIALKLKKKIFTAYIVFWGYFFQNPVFFFKNFFDFFNEVTRGKAIFLDK